MRNWPLCQRRLLGSRRRILAGLFLAAVNDLEMIAEPPREKKSRFSLDGWRRPEEAELSRAAETHSRRPRPSCGAVFGWCFLESSEPSRRGHKPDRDRHPEARKGVRDGHTPSVPLFLPLESEIPETTNLLLSPPPHGPGSAGRSSPESSRQPQRGGSRPPCSTDGETRAC